MYVYKKKLNENGTFMPLNQFKRNMKLTYIGCVQAVRSYISKTALYEDNDRSYDKDHKGYL